MVEMNNFPVESIKFSTFLMIFDHRLVCSVMSNSCFHLRLRFKSLKVFSCGWIGCTKVESHAMKTSKSMLRVAREERV